MILDDVLLSKDLDPQHCLQRHVVLQHPQGTRRVNHHRSCPVHGYIVPHLRQGARVTNLVTGVYTVLYYPPLGRGRLSSLWGKNIKL